MKGPPEGAAPDPEQLDQLAHDLRTPLSAVLMWVRLLRSGAASDLDAGLDAIEKSAQEMSAAIDRLHRLDRKPLVDAGRRDQDSPSEPAVENVAPSAPRVAPPRKGPQRGGGARRG